MPLIKSKSKKAFKVNRRVYMFIPQEIKDLIKKVVEERTKELKQENEELKLEIEDLRTDIQILKEGGNI